MDEKLIPQSLRIGLGVTEEEFRAASRQSMMGWAGTGVGVLLGLILWLMGLRAMVPFSMIVQSIGAGVGCHYLLFGIFPEAKKSNTARMKAYRKLRRYRAEFEKREAAKGPEAG